MILRGDITGVFRLKITSQKYVIALRLFCRNGTKPDEIESKRHEIESKRDEHGSKRHENGTKRHEKYKKSSNVVTYIYNKYNFAIIPKGFSPFRFHDFKKCYNFQRNTIIFDTPLHVTLDFCHTSNGISTIMISRFQNDQNT